MRCLRLAIFPLIMILALTGCAYLGQKPEPPMVRLAGIQMSEMNLFEQRYQLRLRVQNPNDFALPIDGLHCTLYINEREFATGVSDERVMIPRYSEGVITVDVVSDLRRVFEQLRDAGKAKPGLVSYRLSGKVALTGHGAKLPFENSGEFDLRATE